MTDESESRLLTVQLSLARIEGMLEATLKNHSDRLERLAAQHKDHVAAQIADRAIMSELVAKHVGHEERLKDLEETRSGQLPAAAQATGIVAGASAILLGIWNVFRDMF